MAAKTYVLTIKTADGRRVAGKRMTAQSQRAAYKNYLHTLTYSEYQEIENGGEVELYHSVIKGRKRNEANQ